MPNNKKVTIWNIHREKMLVYRTILSMARKCNPIKLWDLTNMVRIKTRKRSGGMSIHVIKKAVYGLVDDGKIIMDYYGNISLI